ncbi:Extensin-like protein C-terminus [Kaistia soli DSM 19436]|uniref:Extensin-like protein C-terminus n=1 Tax=Kaistia soli DSM 19436 TaxID=1122133 RepID=A0A1M4ZUC3_9HYPH|nr:Extensin-like protein C-terminus [Kaistia soli DSM 19436]
MRIGSVIALISLAGCALNFFDEREAWRDQTERACYQQKLVVPSYFQEPSREIDGRGACGIEQPLRVNAFESGVVSVGGSEVVLGCMMTYTMEKWIRNAVQPAAQQRFGMPVTEILTMGTYSCRSRNNRHGDKLSEHAFANAFDVAGFRLADGRTIRVKSDWRNGDPVSQAFLRQTLISACDYFTTVLGPGSNRLHEDHIHIDLAHHNAAGTSRYCRPKLEMPPPTFDPNAPMVSLPPAPGTAPAASMEQRTFTYRWDDQLGTPDATVTGTANSAAVAPAVPADDGAPVRLPPASVPLSYAE